MIEDYLPLRESLSESLTESGCIVDACGDGEEGLWSARNHSYEVIVLDLMLPSLDGLKILEALRKTGDPTPVLIISARDTVQQRVEGLNAGADDYLIKPFAMVEFQARVNALIRRRYDQKATAIEVGDLRIDCLRKEVFRGGEEITLTLLQFRILEYLAYRRGEVVSRAEIAERVYHQYDYGDSNKVDVIISYLRRKIDAPGRKRLIQTRRGYGYVLTDS
ncbi:MAG: response regulator transcription factor [Luteolibacter sp.]